MGNYNAWLPFQAGSGMVGRQKGLLPQAKRLMSSYLGATQGTNKK